MAAQRHWQPSVALQRDWEWSRQQNSPLLATAIDTETTSATWGIPQDYGGRQTQHPIIFGISACVPGPGGLHLLWGRLGTPMFDWMVEQLGRPGFKVAHNSRFDVRVFAAEGIAVAPTVDDTLTMSRIIWDRRKKFDLQTLAEMLCPEVSDWCTPVRKELTRLRREFKKGNAGRPPNYSDVPDEIMGPYSMTDSFLCWLLNARLRPAIDKDFAEFYAREMRVLNLVIDIENVGIPFDADQAEREATILGQRAQRLRVILRAQSGLPDFKPNAPAHVLAACRLLKAPMDTLMKDGVPSTGAELLEGLLQNRSDELSPRLRVFLKNLLAYRAVSKIVGTYLRPLAERSRLGGGRIYCSVNPTNTRTGRACVHPDTLIEMPRDMEKYPNGVPLRDVKIGDWVYTFDAWRELHVRKVKWIGQTQTKPCLKIYTDKGPPLLVSEDHLVRRFRGEWNYAKDLCVGNRLLCMPHRGKSAGYYHFFPHSKSKHSGKLGGGKVKEHRFIWADIRGFTPQQIGAKALVHHVDLRPENNRPDNLERCDSVKQHRLRHSYKGQEGRIEQAIATGIGLSGRRLKDPTRKVYQQRLLWLRQNHVITKIERAGEHLLWDLEVEDTHCFIGNEIALHNSSSGPNFQNLPKA
jgi:hypothetical protein